MVQDAIELTLFVYGLAIVVAFGAALVIKGIVGAVSLAGRNAPAPAVPEPAPMPAPTTAGLPDHDLAVIAAAAYAMLGAHRIVHIEPVAYGTAPGWTAEGRLVHHGSHRPSRHH